MTPSMPARAITFTRRTTPLATELQRHWDWGRRDDPGGKDSTERLCEAGLPLDPERAEEAIARRREQHTLKALADLTAHLREVRDGRKAILLVTEAGSPTAAADRQAAESIPSWTARRCCAT